MFARETQEIPFLALTVQLRLKKKVVVFSIIACLIEKYCSCGVFFSNKRNQKT